MKKIVCILLIFVVGFIACAEGTMESTSNSDAVLEKQTEQAMREMNAQVGMPGITNYQERKLAKMIFELRDKEDLICYAYNFSEVTGKYTFIGQCIGFGLPYSVQYTSPEKLVRTDVGEGYGDVPMPQADPNGLFMPDGLSATWLMLIDEDTGDVSPIYMEPSLTVSPFPLPARICLDGVNK